MYINDNKKLTIIDYLNILKNNNFKFHDIYSDDKFYKDLPLLILNRYVSLFSSEKNLFISNFVNKYIFHKYFYYNKDILFKLLYVFFDRKKCKNEYPKYIGIKQKNININKKIIELFKKYFKCDYLTNNEVVEYINQFKSNEQFVKYFLKILIENEISTNDIKEVFGNDYNSYINNLKKGLKTTKKEVKEIVKKTKELL